jgi:hypothetical protein
MNFPLSFSRLNGFFSEFVLRHTGQIHLLLYVLLQSIISTVCSSNRDDVTIDNVLSHPVGPIPVSMFHEDCTIRKSCKSDLVKQFENEASPNTSATVCAFAKHNINCLQ